jgi:hypothetical protein
MRKRAQPQYLYSTLFMLFLTFLVSHGTPLNKHEKKAISNSKTQNSQISGANQHSPPNALSTSSGVAGVVWEQCKNRFYYYGIFSPAVTEAVIFASSSSLLRRCKIYRSDLKLAQTVVYVRKAI